MNEITQDEKRIRIAKACGWIEVQPDCTGYRLINGNKWYDAVPDYFNDLNAIAAARKSLTPDQRERFAQMLANQLWISCGNSKSISLTYHGVFQLIDATAAQHAEAFGKAMSLW
jgi:hypothetical protein